MAALWTEGGCCGPPVHGGSGPSRGASASSRGSAAAARHGRGPELAGAAFRGAGNDGEGTGEVGVSSRTRGWGGGAAGSTARLTAAARKLDETTRGGSGCG